MLEFWAMILQEIPQSSSNGTEWLSVLTFLVTLLTLILSSYFAYRSAKASEASAKASEASAEIAAKSAELATESLTIQREHNIKSLAAQDESLRIQQEQDIKSLKYAEETLSMQREHNFKSVTPILYIQTLDHDEEVSVKLYNNGVGPLLITNIIITNGIESNHDLISWMPYHPKRISYWTTFIKGFGAMSIYPGGFISFLLLENADPDLPDFVLYRQEARRHLAKLKITVEYKDIYNRPMQPHSGDLRWFGRTLPPQYVEDFKVSLLPEKKHKYTIDNWEKRVSKAEELINRKKSSQNGESIILVRY